MSEKTEIERIVDGLEDALDRLKPYRTTEMSASPKKPVVVSKPSGEQVAPNSCADNQPKSTSANSSRQHASVSAQAAASHLRPVPTSQPSSSSILTYLKISAAAVPVVVFLLGLSLWGTYTHYTMTLKTPWYESLSTQGEKADDFLRKCNIMAAEARWLGDFDQLRFLHDVGCPGVPPQGRGSQIPPPTPARSGHATPRITAPTEPTR